MAHGIVLHGPRPRVSRGGAQQVVADCLGQGHLGDIAGVGQGLVGQGREQEGSGTVRDVVCSSRGTGCGQVQGLACRVQLQALRGSGFRSTHSMTAPETSGS